MTEYAKKSYWVASWHEGPDFVTAPNRVEAIKKARNLSNIAPDPEKSSKAIFVIEATTDLNAKIKGISDQQERLMVFQNLNKIKTYSPVE